MKIQKGQLFRAFYGAQIESDFYRIETLLFNEYSTERTYCYDEKDEMFHRLIFLALEEIDLSSRENIVDVYAVGLDKVGYLEFYSKDSVFEVIS